MPPVSDPGAPHQEALQSPAPPAAQEDKALVQTAHIPVVIVLIALSLPNPNSSVSKNISTWFLTASHSQQESSIARLEHGIATQKYSANLCRGLSSFKMCRPWSTSPHAMRASERSRLKMGRALKKDFDYSKQGKTKAQWRQFP